MKKFAILADLSKPKVQKAVDEFNIWSQGKIIIVGCFQKSEKLEAIAENIDCLIVFGGDGFLLSAARQLGGTCIPVIGVNFGKLGFLAETTITELPNNVIDIVNDQYSTKKRMMLHTDIVRNNNIINTTLSLNDGVMKSTTSRMIFCRISINNEEMCTYGGDGVIVSTPIGSTAYSMSAGGPVLTPDLSAFIITPICPHTLTMRPVIVPSNSTIEITFVPPYPGDCIFTADGQVYFDLQEQDTIIIKQAKQQIYLLETGKRNFFALLKEKFAWGGKKYTFP